MKLSDEEGAIKYSLMGLPNSSSQMRSAREEWVRKNVQLAEENLSRLEELNRMFPRTSSCPIIMNCGTTIKFREIRFLPKGHSPFSQSECLVLNVSSKSMTS
jgi:hypothetical protein